MQPTRFTPLRFATRAAEAERYLPLRAGKGKEMKIIEMILIVGCIFFADIGLSHAQILAELEAGGRYNALSEEICPLMDNLVIEKAKNETDTVKPIGATLKPSDDGLGFFATAGSDGMHFGLNLFVLDASRGAMNLGVGLLHDTKELGRKIVFSKGRLKCKGKTFIFGEGAYIVFRDNKLHGWGIEAQK